MDTLFTTLFLANRPYLIRVAWNVLHDQEEAKDIIQDAFCKLWEKREQLRFTGELKCLMARTVYRLSLDCMSRRETRERFVKRAELITDTEPVDSQMIDRICRIFSGLPGERRKQLFILRHVKGLHYREVARATGVKEQTVLNETHLIAKQIRARLKEAM